MGGFLSAFYAILCFAYIEHSLVSPLFYRMGLPGCIKRYMDDVIFMVAVVTEADRDRVCEFVRWIASPEAYPPPLKMNLEAEGDQEFLEARVIRRGGKLATCSRLFNKVVDDWEHDRAPYRVRLPPSHQVPRRLIQDLVTGIATWCVQYGSDQHQLTISLLELRLECLISEVKDSIFLRSLECITARYKSNEVVLEAVRHKGLRRVNASPKV